MFSCSPGLSALNLGVWSPLWKCAKTLVIVRTPLRLTGGTSRNSERRSVLLSPFVWHHCCIFRNTSVLLEVHYKLYQMVLKSQLADTVYTCTHTYVLSRVQLCVTPWTVSCQYSGKCKWFSVIYHWAPKSLQCILHFCTNSSPKSIFFKFWYWVM